MNYEIVTPSFSTCHLKFFDSYIEAQESYVFDWHIHREYEMILLTSVPKQVFIGEEELELNKGDIILINSLVPHKTFTKTSSTWVLLQFDISSEGNLFEELKLGGILGATNTPYTLFKQGTPLNKELTDCIFKIKNESNDKKGYYDYFIKSYLYELIALLYRHGILTDYNKFLKEIPHLLPVLKYISEHYSEHISLADISSVANMHSSYFCKVFRSALGISFVEYLNLVRISNAKTLLEETKKNVTEIAFEVGFSSVSYFIKTFKKYNSHSPNKYKSLLAKK